MKRLLKQHRFRRFLIKILMLYLGFNAQAIAQQIIQGKVTDEMDEPLTGVNVLVKGTHKGTNTDVDGFYKIEVDKNEEVEFTFMSYLPKKVKVGNQTTINIAMEPNNKVLDEVIVMGYGSQVKKKILGSVQSVDNKELKDIPVAQITQKLQGKLAGVQIYQASGRPGEGMTVKIRGQTSILGGSDPLYVVDGFPIVGDISGINPDEIEKISVLKDAASSSLYGSRAANGVVLITTKQAKNGRSTINLNVYTGLQSVPHYTRPKLMNAQEFAQFQKESYEDKGEIVPDKFKNPSQYIGNSTDWYDILLRVAPVQSYNLALTSSKDGFSTSAVLGVLNQEGVVLNSGYERYSLRINSDYSVSDKVKIGFNVAPSYSIRNGVATDGVGGLLNQAGRAFPTSPYKNPDGSLPLSVDGYFPTPNYYRSATEITDETKKTTLISNMKIQYEPIKGLVLKSTFNVDLENNAFLNFSPTTATISNAIPPVLSSIVIRNYKHLSWLNENTATYSKTWNEHTIEVLAGYTNQYFSSDYNQISGFGLPDDRIETIQSAENINRGETVNDFQKWALTSYLARVNYDFKGKYLLTAAIRRDGSSRFGADNRWGNFPSIGAGWVVSDEAFAEKIESLSFAKLRTSYGVLGNNSIGNYSQYALVGGSNAVFGDAIASGSVPVSLGNSRLGWETTAQFDLGFDLGLFNNRISFTYDFYNKITSNLLYNVSIPKESGFGSFNDNVGKIKFWGHEFSLNTKNLTGNLKWNTNFNISFNSNKVLALADGVERIYGGSFRNEDFRTITQVGQPIGQLYGLIHDGVYKNQADFDNSPKAEKSEVGTVKFRDTNGDGKITFGGDNDDRVVIGNPFPKALIGMTNSFTYKSFDFTVVGAGAFGKDMIIATEQATTNLDGVFNVLSDVKDRWRSEDNPGSGRYGKTTSATYMERDWSNSRFISDASYFTIKNVTLGYNLPIKSSFIKTARLYGSIQQLYVFTNYRGVNPEGSSSYGGQTPSSLDQGMDWGEYPIPRTFSIGMNLAF